MPPRLSLVSSFDRNEDDSATKQLQQQQNVEVILEKDHEQQIPESLPSSKLKKRTRRPSSSILQSRDSIVSTTSTLSSSSYHGTGNNNNSPDQHHRRRSSVSFDGATEVIEFLKLNKGDRENVWYNKKELSEIKQECRRLAKQASEASIEVEEETRRGLEHLMISDCGRERASSSSPRRPSNRKHCRDVVFSEHANQILEYGYICDDERLALEYKMAAESSKRVALERGYLDAETAWGDEDASSSSSSSYQEAHC